MKQPRGKVGAVIVAAGGSERMGGVDKIFAELDGEPLLSRVVDVFQECALIDKVVIVLGRRNLKQGQGLVQERGWSKVVAVCAGGAKRQDSVKEGLSRLSDCDWVIIHDGARPLITVDLISRGLEEAQESGAAIAALPVKETIKIVSRSGFVQQTPRRQSLWAAQTPQVFQFEAIAEAHRQENGEATDDAMLLEQLGHKVRVYMGSSENIKVTTPEDLILAEIILRNRRKAAPFRENLQGEP